MEVVDRNVVVGGGELDIIGFDRGTRVAFEVRSITGRGAAIEAFDNAKVRQVGRLAGLVRCGRVDVVAVRFGVDGVDIHWIKGVG